MFNTGRCCGPRDAGGEAGAVRRRRSFAGGLVGQVLRGGRPGGARVGLLAENRRGGLADIDALQRNGADAVLADLGLSLAQREAIRAGLAAFL